MAPPRIYFSIKTIIIYTINLKIFISIETLHNIVKVSFNRRHIKLSENVIKYDQNKKKIKVIFIAAFRSITPTCVVPTCFLIVSPTEIQVNGLSLSNSGGNSLNIGVNVLSCKIKKTRGTDLHADYNTPNEFI